MNGFIHSFTQIISPLFSVCKHIYFTINIILLITFVKIIKYLLICLLFYTRKKNE